MNIPNQETLSQFSKRKLGVNIKELSELMGVPYSTLQHRWFSEAGQKALKDQIILMAVAKAMED